MISKILVIYSKKQTPQNLMISLKQIMEKFRQFHPTIRVEWANADTWDEEKVGKIINAMRTASARFKFRIRSKGAGPLALSNSGSLNLSNTPIICGYDESHSLILVLPSARGPKHAKFDVLQTLSSIVDGKLKMEELISGSSVEEKDIMNMLRWYPHLIEPGLTFKDWEVLIDNGRIDLVFLDEKDNHLLVEVEITVTDQALGQVIRFREPYARKMNIPIEKVRLALIGIDVDENVINGVKGLIETPITLYKFGLKPIVDNYHHAGRKRSDEQ